jgi:hypothetical protein
MIAQVSKGVIVLVNGQILEKCKVLLDDSRYLIVQLSPPARSGPAADKNPVFPGW